jgi:AraC family transcriptional regulator, regulatory protein of adaptative response / methylated-DNA-[protein]-cysteine methyltransferase
VSSFRSRDRRRPPILQVMNELRHDLPDPDEMLRAFLERDSRYDGVFWTGVTTTGIFCRPSCPARKPRPERLRFFRSADQAAGAGFRPCLRCRPTEATGLLPPELRRLVEELEARPGLRLGDRELRARGLDPATVRRHFQRVHGTTFHGWQRGRRLAGALDALAGGAPITAAAFDAGYESLSGFADALRALTGAPPSGSRGRQVVQLDRLPTPLGPMLAGFLGDHLVLLEFADRRMLPAQLRTLSTRLDAVLVPGRSAASRALSGELDAWFDGRLDRFQVPVRLAGTPFQEEVWNELLRIPKGEVRSYSEQAAALGRPEAVRAVARANGANRIALVVPCHRVVGADGRLRGYGGGLARKRALLELEGWRPRG